MTAGWWFVAYGVPAPQGSKSFKGVHGGKAVMAESSLSVAPWRQVVTLAAHAARRAGAVPVLNGPLLVSMVFTVRRPRSAPKRLVAPATAPDLDKYIRSTCDAVTDAALWGDDGQVARINAGKVWAGYSPDALPGTGVRVVCVPMTVAGGAVAEHDELRLACLEAHPAPPRLEPPYVPSGKAATQGARP